MNLIKFSENVYCNIFSYRNIIVVFSLTGNVKNSRKFLNVSTKSEKLLSNHLVHPKSHNSMTLCRINSMYSDWMNIPPRRSASSWMVQLWFGHFLTPNFPVRWINEINCKISRWPTTLWQMRPLPNVFKISPDLFFNIHHTLAVSHYMHLLLLAHDWETHALFKLASMFDSIIRSCVFS